MFILNCWSQQYFEVFISYPFYDIKISCGVCGLIAGKTLTATLWVSLPYGFVSVDVKYDMLHKSCLFLLFYTRSCLAAFHNYFDVVSFTYRNRIITRIEAII